MFRKDIFLSKMVYAGYNQKMLARELNITDGAMSIKIKNGKFTREDMEKLIYLLNLDPLDTFFYREEADRKNEVS